jgi:hypothetical protein
MGFDTEGFLGAEALHLVDEQRATYSDLFEFAQECSVTVMKAAAQSIQKDNKSVLLRVMFTRCIAQYQGAVILAERGLTIESMILTRSLFESNFVLGALAANKVTPEQLANSDFKNRSKLGNALLPMAKSHSPPEQHEKLSDFVEEHANDIEISFYDLADKAGMLIAYNGIYRALSHFAAHPSVTAASDYYVDMPNGNGHVVFQPLVKNTPRAILTTANGILYTCGIFQTVTQWSNELDLEIKIRLEREEALHQKYYDAAV